MKKTLVSLCLCLTVIGFLLSLIVHICSFFNYLFLGKFAWSLHVFSISFMFPAILTLKSLGNSKNWCQVIKDYVPVWTLTLISIFFIYAFVNFAFFFFQDHKANGSPMTRNGEYVVRKDRDTYIPISYEEYSQLVSISRKGFSGNWLFFFSFESVVLLAGYNVNKRKIMNTKEY